MKLKIIQPEERHHDVFPLWLKKYDATEYIVLDFENELPKSIGPDDFIIFNSWGFTKYSLLNLFRILSYKKFSILIHSGARFCLDKNRFQYSKAYSYYYCARALLDFLFLLVLFAAGKVTVFALDDNVKSYVNVCFLGKFIAKLQGQEVRSLVHDQYKILTKNEYLIQKISFSKFLLIGEFNAKRIDIDVFKKFVRFHVDRQLDLSVDVVGKADKTISNEIKSMFKCVQFRGFLPVNELEEIILDTECILAVNNKFVYDHGFIDEYFVTKSSGMILFGKPILLWR